MSGLKVNYIYYNIIEHSRNVFIQNVVFDNGLYRRMSPELLIFVDENFKLI